MEPSHLHKHFKGPWRVIEGYIHHSFTMYDTASKGFEQEHGQASVESLFKNSERFKNITINILEKTENNVREQRQRHLTKGGKGGQTNRKGTPNPTERRRGNTREANEWTQTKQPVRLKVTITP